MMRLILNRTGCIYLCTYSFDSILLDKIPVNNFKSVWDWPPASIEIYSWKHTGTIFCYRVLVSWVIYLFSFQRCADVRLSWQYLFSVSVSPGPRRQLHQASADLLQKPKQFCAATWQASGGWVTSGRGATSRGWRSKTVREDSPY